MFDFGPAFRWTGLARIFHGITEIGRHRREDECAELIGERNTVPPCAGEGKRMGMGLGLLTAKRIVERHRGRIEVESRVGEGSTFTVFVPGNLEAGGDS